MAFVDDYFNLLIPGGPSRPQVFLYAPPAGSSNADAVATVRGAGFITSGKAKGARLNDIVITVDTSTPLVTFSRVSAINATTGALTLTA